MDCKGVLIIDDEDPIREIISNILEFEGYRVDGAENGLEALKFLKNCSESELPGLIILDMMMPVMDGLTFLKEFSQTTIYESAPVVVMSANSLFTEEAVKRFSVKQMKKPVDFDRLLQAVREHCGHTNIAKRGRVSEEKNLGSAIEMDK